MGGGKGGPISLRVVKAMRNYALLPCFHAELWRHIGPDMDVPAGDIGAGGREVGYMFGSVQEADANTPEPLPVKAWNSRFAHSSGSYRFGACYFVQQMLKDKGTSFEGKTVGYLRFW